MTSRRPSPRPSSRRRAGADGARSTREINAEKSRQRRAAQAAEARGGKASAGRGQSASESTGGGARRRFFRGGAPANERNVSREGKAASVMSIGGLDVPSRLVVVLVVAAVLAVMLMPSLTQWWQQENELAQIKAQVAEQERKNAQMQRQLELWNDPDYVSTQARERLGYVRPGETQYTVVDPGPQYQDSALAAAATPTGPARPWVQQLAILVGKVDQPPHSTPIPSTLTSQSGYESNTGQESGE